MNRIGEESGHRDWFDPSFGRVVRQPEAIGDHHQLDRRFFNTPDRFPGQNWMNTGGENVLRPGVLQLLGGCGQRSGGVDGVVDHDAELVLDPSDEPHRLELTGRLASLLEEDHVAAEPISIGFNHLGRTSIWGDKNESFSILPRKEVKPATEPLLDRGQHHRPIVEVIDDTFVRIVESLDLGGVKIGRDQSLDAGELKHVGHESRRDGYSWLVLPVLTGVAVIWHDDGDLLSRRADRSVGHQEQLHEVGMIPGVHGLDDDDVRGTDVGQLGANLTVGKPTDGDRFEAAAESRSDGFGQRTVGGASQQFQGTWSHGASKEEFVKRT